MIESPATVAGADPDDCSVCRRLRAESPVYADASWVALPSPQRPGWLTLATRRHGDWVWDLDPGEAATLGTAMQVVGSAARRALPTERLYVLGFGEQTSHFHVLLVPELPALHAGMKEALRVAGPQVADKDLAEAAAGRLSEEMGPREAG